MPVACEWQGSDNLPVDCDARQSWASNWKEPVSLAALPHMRALAWPIIMSKDMDTILAREKRSPIPLDPSVQLFVPHANQAPVCSFPRA